MGGKSKGFNLFSALVAAVLIATSVVLVNTLVSTEDKMSNQLYGMFNNYQLNDAANLARADALQSFNYSFREQLEDYLTYSDIELAKEPGMNIVTMENYDDWDQIVKNFESVILLTNETDGKKFDAALEYVANRTIDNFHPGSYGRYNVELSSRNAAAKNTVKNAISKAVKAQQALGVAAGNESIMEVVGCKCSSPGDSADDCTLGTFYFNIPLNLISSADYEALPRIIVKDLITGEEIKIAILPRTNLKIYIPLRFFRALCESTLNAKAIDQANRTIKDYRLGFCDTGCNPRTDASSSNTGNWLEHKCPTGAGDDLELTNKPATYALSFYKPGEGKPGNVVLNAYAIEKICDNWLTKSISTGSLDFANTNANGVAFGGKNGLSVVPSNINNVIGCPFYSLNAYSAGYQTKTLGEPNQFLTCAQIRGVQADVLFEDKNPLYIISGATNKYLIRVTDDRFVPQANNPSEKCATGATASSGPIDNCLYVN